MPELPEVETIRRGLEPRIKDVMLQSVEVLEPKTAHFTATDVDEHILNHKVTAVRRRAKVLIWDFDGDWSLLFHLKMTGQVISVLPDGHRFAGGHPTGSMAGSLPDRSTRLIFVFAEGQKVFFNDQRKFGWVKALPTAKIEKVTFLAGVGPEPLSDYFDFNDFYARGRKRQAPIKAVLLDQALVAGLGNIYVDETLHLAGIHPARTASKLTKDQWQRIHAAIKLVIDTAIGQGGTSFTNYVNVLGTRGDYLETARVFRRQGRECKVCGNTIIKIRVAGRGTHLCPVCQPAPRTPKR